MIGVEIVSKPTENPDKPVEMALIGSADLGAE